TRRSSDLHPGTLHGRTYLQVPTSRLHRLKRLLWEDPGCAPLTRATRPTGSPGQGRRPHPGNTARARHAFEHLHPGHVAWSDTHGRRRSEEHTSELQSREYLVCRLLLDTK